MTCQQVFSSHKDRMRIIDALVRENITFTFQPITDDTCWLMCEDQFSHKMMAVVMRMIGQITIDNRVRSDMEKN